MRRYSDVQYDKTSAPVADVTEDVEITEYFNLRVRS